ncbi:MAG: CDGSH iron-sulfur domain-containing protein [Actinomycetota bacterium]|nr:CDGSH iron-sulfur domain-containing protein [Actinomycetota bacterium]
MTDEKNITIAAGGPYIVTGNVAIRSKSAIMSELGEPLGWKTEPAAETKARVALCRCGASAKKPYCDGAHARTEWDGTENAPPRQLPGTGQEPGR